ncbi:MAG TPA: response regulator [Xanthobacteraceae bacterium]|nr:response regulator [Xanthobacteraceae bacterium]
MIALIDDDGSFRNALYESLSSLGYGVHAFESANDFVASAKNPSYDCIISDVHMPGMSGIELTKLLGARGSRVPVILVTGRTEPGLEVQAAAGGALCLLRKPFDTQALMVRLRQAMGD